MKRRVFIVEDHEIVRESYVMYLNTLADLEVCGAVETAEEALACVEEAAPDVMLVDVSLPGMSGIELIQRLRAAGYGLPTLVLTGHDSDVYRHNALQAGAKAFVMKHEGPDALVSAIHDVFREAS